MSCPSVASHALSRRDCAAVHLPVRWRWPMSCLPMRRGARSLTPGIVQALLRAAHLVAAVYCCLVRPVAPMAWRLAAGRAGLKWEVNFGHLLHLAASPLSMSCPSAVSHALSRNECAAARLPMRWRWPVSCLPMRGGAGRLTPSIVPSLLRVARLIAHVCCCLARPVEPMAWRLALLVARA
ncbi:hypothetical protein HAX54_053102 [Datura stramonium]|uniref:Uncharacterized protein n=1 Tax=Datura stramonium TaxID=4076 RepID=A0ABS8RU17_DATST|nr:hypothetical protein [Datura stramonium]